MIGTTALAGSSALPPITRFPMSLAADNTATMTITRTSLVESALVHFARTLTRCWLSSALADFKDVADEARTFLGLPHCEPKPGYPRSRTPNGIAGGGGGCVGAAS